MSSITQAQWFVKWQQFPAKARFDHLTYLERTIHAHEIIVDKVDNFVPLARYIRERYLEDRALTNAVMEREFGDICEQRASECMFENGEWSIPRFDGVQKLQRTRITQEQVAMRQVNVSDADALVNLWKGGRRNRMMFRSGVSSTDVLNGCIVNGCTFNGCTFNSPT